MILISVDLPAPFSPTSACTSPARTSNETSDSACTPGKDLLMPRTSRSGAAAPVYAVIAASARWRRRRRRSFRRPPRAAWRAPSGGAPASVISVSMRDSGQTTRLPLDGEFRGVGQHDQLVGALKQLRLGARDQRVALDDAARADRHRAHEHQARRIVLDRVVVERRDDQLLGAVDLPAGQRDAVLRLVNEEFRQRIGVGRGPSAFGRAGTAPSGRSSCRR